MERATGFEPATFSLAIPLKGATQRNRCEFYASQRTQGSENNPACHPSVTIGLLVVGEKVVSSFVHSRPCASEGGSSPGGGPPFLLEAEGRLAPRSAPGLHPGGGHSGVLLVKGALFCEIPEGLCSKGGGPASSRRMRAPTPSHPVARGSAQDAVQGMEAFENSPAGKMNALAYVLRSFEDGAETAMIAPPSAAPPSGWGGGRGYEGY